MADIVTGTAHVNVVTGRVTVQVPGATDTDIYPGPAGTLLFLQADVEPWGVDELGMERADQTLERMGWHRDGEWAGSETPTCPVAAP